MKKHFQKKKNHFKGFTLIEILVSLALFASVMVIGASALIFVIEGSRKTRSTSSIMGELSYALENISRNLRVGHSFNCGASVPIEEPSDCGGEGGESVAFESMVGEIGNSNDQWVYKYDGEKILRSTDGGSNFMELTSDSIEIENMKFYVKGSTRGDGEQPRVVIVVGGYIELSNGTRSDFDIQTSVSQRVLDF